MTTLANEPLPGGCHATRPPRKSTNPDSPLPEAHSNRALLAGAGGRAPLGQVTPGRAGPATV